MSGTNEDEVRRLVLAWAEAVHAGDLDGVLADHADDLVVFDVPPPERGHCGLAAYAATWPPFFAWQASGADFDVEELHVDAGDDVAVVWALLRCGTPEEHAREPDRRLRLTMGLRRRAGRWVVQHEHHSFTHPG